MGQGRGLEHLLPSLPLEGSFPTLPTPTFWTFNLKNCEKTNALKSVVLCYHSPSKLIISFSYWKTSSVLSSVLTRSAHGYVQETKFELGIYAAKLIAP
jgi:hypothetical protein